jgi:hypothetical protein
LCSPFVIGSALWLERSMPGDSADSSYSQLDAVKQGQAVMQSKWNQQNGDLFRGRRLRLQLAVL